MRFFKKNINLDLVEHIEWYTEMDCLPFISSSISSCKLFFQSGHTQLVMRQPARELFDFLDGEELKHQALAKES